MVVCGELENGTITVHPGFGLKEEHNKIQIR
jgi:hypothetical protein